MLSRTDTQLPDYSQDVLDEYLHPEPAHRLTRSDHAKIQQLSFFLIRAIQHYRPDPTSLNIEGLVDLYNLMSEPPNISFSRKVDFFPIMLFLLEFDEQLQEIIGVRPC